MIEQYGADTVRLFILFKAPPENVLEWDINAIQGIYRWLSRLWYSVNNLISNLPTILSKNETTLTEEEKKLLTATHQAIKQVTYCMSIEQHTFNVAIAELMKLSNTMNDLSNDTKNTKTYYKSIRSLLLMLSPMAPHIASEMWHSLVSQGPQLNGDWFGDSSNLNILDQKWPVYNPDYLLSNNRKITIMVFVNNLTIFLTFLF